MTPTSPAEAALACARCGTALPREDWNSSAKVVCRACRAPVTALVFPAFFRKLETSTAVAAAEGEASCFNHPAKKAAVACDQCGRFVCTLCQVELDGQNWCPACIETRRQKGKLVNLETRRTLYDSMVLQLSIWPIIIMWPVTLVTAPLAVYLGIRHRKDRPNLVRKTRVRLYVGLVLASFQVLIWLWGFAYLISRL